MPVAVGFSAVGSGLAARVFGFLPKGLEFCLYLVVGDTVDVGFTVLQAAVAGFQATFTAVVLGLLAIAVCLPTEGSFLADEVFDVALFSGEAYFLGIEVGLIGVEALFVSFEALGFVAVEFIGAGLGEARLVGELVVENLLVLGEGFPATIERLLALSDVFVSGNSLFGEVGFVLFEAVAQVVHEVAALVLLEKLFANATGFGDTVETTVDHCGHFHATQSTYYGSANAADGRAPETGSGGSGQAKVALDGSGNGFEASSDTEAEDAAAGETDEPTGSGEGVLNA